MSNPQRILITGASRGLGYALAKAYARPGVSLLLTATNQSNLEEVKGACEKTGAKVTCLALDLASFDSVTRLVDELAEHPSPDLYIANAGVFSGRKMDGSEEDQASRQWQFDVNLSGTVALTEAVSIRMEDAGEGHIALVSSLAALQPQTDSPAYSASKSGLASYGKARRLSLLQSGIALSIIYPGHIETEQTAIHVGALPGLISAPKAASLIVHALARKKRTIAIPRYIYWLVRLSNLLPLSLQVRVNAPFRYRVDDSAKSKGLGNG